MGVHPVDEAERLDLGQAVLDDGVVVRYDYESGVLHDRFLRFLGLPVEPDRMIIRYGDEDY
jgi:hypothetical protein